MQWSKKFKSVFVKEMAPKGFTRVFTAVFRMWFLTFFLVLLVGWFGHTIVQQKMKMALASELTTSLNASKKGVEIWIENKKRMANVWAEESGTRRYIAALVKLAERAQNDPEILLHSKELADLRGHLGPVAEKYGFVGFVVTDNAGFQIGALLDEPVGEMGLVARIGFIQRSLSGETVVSTPFIGEVALPNVEGELKTDWPTMFVSTPVRNDEGEIIAVLCFRIRPETQFTQRLEINRIGESGEVYAFDMDGLMISNSRFNIHLRQIGLIADRPDSRAILNVSIRDPGGNMVEGHRSAIPRENQPLTLMAKSAISGKSGVNVDGYNDYRGVPVVGAWVWLPEVVFGITSEIDVEEAFSTLNTLRAILFLFFSLFAFSSLTALILDSRKNRIMEERIKAQTDLFVSEERTRSVVDHVIEGVITIYQDGTIESFNPAAEKIFGYPASEVIGKNVNLLMPDPHHTEHDNYLQRYKDGGQATVLGRPRELPGLRKDGTVFDLELSASDMKLGDQQLFIGIVRDITDRKKAEKRLEQLHRQNEMILTSAGEGIFGLDLTAKITFMNPAAGQMLGAKEVGLVGQPVTRLLFPSEEKISLPLLGQNPIFTSLKNCISCRVSKDSFWRTDGTDFPVEYIATSTVEDGKIVGAVVTFNNITDRLRAEKKLQLYASDLEKMNQELKDFTYIASHDLQEPLRKVITLGDRLRLSNGEKLDEEGHKYLFRMQESTARMQRLIYDLLDYSRTSMEAPNYEVTDLREELDDVLYGLDVDIEKVNGKVVVHDLPSMEVNRFQMRQLFQNLISNALKFHQKDTPPLITISSRQVNGDSCEIMVEDNGIGFDEKYLSRIFKPFQQLHGRNVFRGSGIGLSICAKIVNGHHGTITAKSQPDKGSRFIITLPLKQETLPTRG